MQVSVVTPEGPIFESTCHDLSVFAHDGSMGILPGHAPLVTELGAGLLRANSENGTEEVVLAGGYLQVLDNKVTILATGAWRLGEIDRAQAEKDLEEALGRTTANDDELEDKERALARARALIANA